MIMDEYQLTVLKIREMLKVRHKNTSKLCNYLFRLLPGKNQRLPHTILKTRSTVPNKTTLINEYLATSEDT